MKAWLGEEGGDRMEPTVTRNSAKDNAPPLKNGSDLRESGHFVAVGSKISGLRRKYRKRIQVFVISLVVILLLITFMTTIILYAMTLHRKPVRICESRECLRSAANLALSMDTRADPCEDFYQYVCGNWGDEHPRPDSFLSHNWFSYKGIKVYSIMRDLFNKNITHYPKPVQQAKDMFDGCMDTDKRGLKPVMSVLESVGLPPFPTFINATDDFDYSTYEFNWLDTVIKIKTQIGMDVLIGFDISTDPRNSSLYRLFMGSPRITDPFPRAHNKRKRHNGRKHIGSLIKIIEENKEFVRLMNRRSDKFDDDENTGQVHKIFYEELIKLFVIESDYVKESKLSEVELDQNIKLSSEEYYNRSNDIYEFEYNNSTEIDDDDYDLKIPEYKIQEIQSHTDAVVENNNGTASPIWKKYLKGIFNVSKVALDFEKDKVLVSNSDLKYMSLMAAYISKTPPVVLELYIWVTVVEVLAVHTTTELQLLFQPADEQSHSPATLPPRSLQCAFIVNNMLGMAVSYSMADPYFFNVTKPKIITMIDELKNSLAHLIGETKWMDDNTKLATYQKLIEMKSLIGFPDWLLEEGKLEEYYDGIEIDPSKHLENMINIIQVKNKKALNRFREGNDVTWVNPTEVNAYYMDQENAISVPMVMLQYPFFDLGLDSLNYGSVGSVLGHEITHGFDDSGRKFDKNGNMLPWWSNDSIESFINMTQCLVDQYSTFYVSELDEYIDGERTLGENIADNGGVREALAALRHHLRRKGPEPKLPGFEHMNSEQLFFLSYANLWCGVNTEKSLKRYLRDVHPPGPFRLSGVLQNIEDFAKAWHCKPDSAMNPRKRCIIF